jgi:hypothetical protein
MTKKEYRRLHKVEKITLNDSLNIVTSFMTDKDSKKELYKDNLRSRINNFFCKRSHKKVTEEKDNDRFAGLCMPVPKINFVNRLFKRYKKTKIYCDISINDSLSNYYLSNLLLALHEIHHADTNQYVNSGDNYYYVGFRKVIIVDGDKEIYIGDGLNECFNELYTQISFYQNHPKCYTNINNVDDLIYKPYKPVFIDEIDNNGEIYRNLGLLVKLLIIACDNGLNESYESLKDTPEKFVSKTVKLDDGIHYVKNDALYVGKFGATGFEKNFDELLGQKGSFETLLKDFDYLLYQLNNYEYPNKQVVSDIIRLIDSYKERKYEIMVERGLWSPMKKLHSNMIYETYKTYVKSMFRLYPAKVTDIDVEKTYKYELKKTGND